MKKYNVTVSNKSVIWVQDSIVEILAKTSAEAIKKARWHMRYNVGHGSADGELSYKAAVE